MSNAQYDDVGHLISYIDNLGNKVNLYYDEYNRVNRSQTDYDYIIYYYDDNDRVYYQEIFNINNKLMRKVWWYYNDKYLDHIVSDDGINIWLDENMNKI